MEATISIVRRGISRGVDTQLRSLVLLERGRWIRQLVDVAITGIKLEPIPSCLGEGQRAILVSNYPSVSHTLRAVMKLACRMPGEKIRLRAIARPEVVTEATPLLTALGVQKFVFPVHKDDAGAYRLDTKVLRQVLAYLNGSGHILWLSLTGRTRGNGLLEEDVRTGAALFCVKKGIPLVPMGLVTKEEQGKLKVVQVRFGEPMNPPELGGMTDTERPGFLMGFSRLAMCSIARLLPVGQRGDFENADERLVEASRCLGDYGSRLG